MIRCAVTMSSRPSTGPDRGATPAVTIACRPTSSFSNSSPAGSEGGPLLAAVAALHHQQLGRSVQQIGRRERDLQSPAVVVDGHGLAVGGVVGQIVPPHRQTGAGRDAADHLDRARPGTCRPGAHEVDLRRGADQVAHERDVVHKAAEHHVGVEVAHVLIRVTERGITERVEPGPRLSSWASVEG